MGVGSVERQRRAGTVPAAAAAAAAAAPAAAARRAGLHHQEGIRSGQYHRAAAGAVGRFRTYDMVVVGIGLDGAGRVTEGGRGEGTAVARRYAIGPAGGGGRQALIRVSGWRNRPLSEEHARL